MKNIKEIKEDVSIWWYGVKWKTERSFKATIAWIENNKEVAIAMIPVGIMALKGIGKAANSLDRKIDLKREEDLKELYIYDHSLGIYHKLRRPLKPSEKIEIDRRRAEGESKIHILASMGLLD